MRERDEERLGLLRCQDRGWLVQDEDLRVAVEGLQDLDALLLADRELPDPGARIDGHSVAVGQLRNPMLDRSRADSKSPAGLAQVAEDDILRDREWGDQPEVLVHHADPRLDRLPW